MDNNAYDEVDDEKRNNMKAMQKLGIAEKDSPAFDPGEPEPLDEEVTGCMRYVEVIQMGLGNIVKRNGKLIQAGVIGILAILLHIFLGLAINYNFDKALPLLVIMALAWILIIYYHAVKPLFGDPVYHSIYLPTEAMAANIWKLWIVRWAVYVFGIILIAAFLIWDTTNDRYRLMPLAGLAAFVLILFLFSTNPAKVDWRPVVWGLLLQFLLGLLVLRWEWGKTKFNEASDLVVQFLDFTSNGTTFVYGFLAAPPNICGMDPIFAFTSLQVVVYFGAIVAVLYYYGIMQWVLKKIAWAMQMTLGTTATESLNAAACIFLGQAEAPLLIKPYLEKMTESELHAVMTSGFACIAGSLFAAYISFGACPEYLLSATVMSAPAALAVSKLFCPETQQSHLTRIEDLELPEGEERNALEAISNGAVMAVELVFAIIANLIVFLALLAFLDNIIGWFGDMVGYQGTDGQQLSFEKILSYIFFPLAFLMGVGTDTTQVLRVAELMGTKTVLNEFIAFQKMGQMTRAGLLSGRAQMIATYALCGFSNFSSIGIQLGILGGMAPGRKSVLSKIALRALIAGSFACFMTACVAGILVETPKACNMTMSGQNCFDVTYYQALLNNQTTMPPSSTMMTTKLF